MQGPGLDKNEEWVVTSALIFIVITDHSEFDYMLYYRNAKLF